MTWRKFMKKDTTKKQFLKLIKADLYDHLTLSASWNKMHKDGIDRDFLVNGDHGTIFDFICNIANKNTDQNCINTPMIFNDKPSFAVKFASALPEIEVTTLFTKEGFPQGYIETLDKEGHKGGDYSRYFGLLDDHSLFYEDTAKHNGKRVCTFVNLRSQDVFKFNESHEAYRRVINPAIAKIEEQLAKHNMGHSIKDKEAEL